MVYFFLRIMDKHKSEKSSKENVERQIKRLHRLAERLPWIVVFFVALAAIVTIIEVFLKIHSN